MPKLADLPPEIINEIIRRANLVERVKFSVTSRFFKEFADTHALTLIKPFSVDELKLLSDKGNAITMGLNRQELTYFKNPKESFSDWYDRLENSSSYIVQTKMLIKIESPEQLAGGKIVQTQAEVKKISMNFSCPVYIKVNLPSVILKQRLSNKEFKSIAPLVAEINGRAVSFNESDNKFEEKITPTLGNK